jgi:eukaryotic-like serine/threonine-protein kinase
MSSGPPCPQCKEVLAHSVPGGLCPRCVLRVAINLDSAEPGPASGCTSSEADSGRAVPRVALRRYKIQAPLGEGGMGLVEQAQDRGFDRVIAIKSLRPKHLGNPELEARFVRERRIHSRLQHPGIAPVHDLGTLSDGRPFFTMKLIRGHTLAGLLKNRTDPAHDLTRFLKVFEQVCQTIAYVHSEGVIHRDLKPGNIMVGAFGEVQVMDWGLAKELVDGSAAERARGAPSGRGNDRGSETSAGAVLGTYPYMPPEQAQGRAEVVDRRADVFALGSILCEILTGAPAYGGRSVREVRLKAREGNLLDALDRLGTCGADEELLRLAYSCLSPAPKDRPGDAGQLAEALSAHFKSVQERLRAAELARVESQAREKEAQARAAQERRARRLTVALAASVVVTMTLTGVALFGYAWQRQVRGRQFARVVDEANLRLAQAEQAETDQLAWSEALAAAQRVEQRGNETSDAAMRRMAAAVVGRVRDEAARAERDRKLLDRLFAVRGGRSRIEDRWAASADADYALAFKQYGVDVLSLPAATAAEKLRARPAAVVVEVVAALDDWALHRRLNNDAKAPWAPLVELTRALDPDAVRDELRRIFTATDFREEHLSWVKGHLKTQAVKATQADWPVATVVLLAVTLVQHNQPDAAADLLLAMQPKYPRDVWLNYELAGALETVRPPRTEEAIRFLTVVQALRPELAHRLGDLLAAQHRTTEAIRVFEGMIRLQPEEGHHFLCLARALRAHGDKDGTRRAEDQAIRLMRERLRYSPEEAIVHTRLGLIFSDQEKWAEAAGEYQQAIALRPDDTLAHECLGLALYKMGKWEEAAAESRLAIRLDRDRAKAHENLGLALGRLHRHQQALEQLQEAVQLNPTNAGVYVNLGAWFLRQGKWEEAAAASRQAIGLKPDLDTARLNLALALHHLGKPDEALVEIRKAIELKPNSAASRASLGHILSDQKKWHDAIASFQESIHLDPNDPKAHYQLGYCLCQEKRWEEAASAFCVGLRLDPNDAMAHANLGAAQAGLLRWEDALAEYQEAIRLKPDYVDAHYNMAVALTKQNRWDEAIAEYRVVVGLQPDNAQAYSDLGFALSRQRRWEEARAAYQNAVARFPNIAQGRVNLGLALSGMEQWPAAENQLREAVRLQPDSADAHHSFAAALIGQGKTEEAVKAIRAAIRVIPEKANAYYQLGNVLHDQGKGDEAIEAFRAAVQHNPKFAEAHCNLGGVLTAKGDYVEALIEFRRGHELGSHKPGWRYPSAVWVRKAERRIELEELLPGVLSDKAKPKDAAEAAELAQLSALKQLHGASARLWKEAFQEQVALAEDRSVVNRWNAACEAALAGCGQGKDMPPLDDDARARWRGQALDWLNAELAAETKLYNSGRPDYVQRVNDVLTRWKRSDVLSSVRDEAALAKLREEEALSWRAFWGDVDALLKRSAAKAPR